MDGWRKDYADAIAKLSHSLDLMSQRFRVNNYDDGYSKNPPRRPKNQQKTATA